MNSPSTTPAARSYSPFWALLFVFVTLVFLQCAYLRASMQERVQIQAASEQLKPVLAKAKTVSGTTEAVGRDLLLLSTKSAEAAKIVAEFNIKLNGPTNAPAATAPQSK